MPKMSSKLIHEKLDYAESLSPDMIYMGTCGEHKAKPLEKGWIRCSALCAHAYGVNTTRATVLEKRMKLVASKQTHKYYKTNWDVAMRGYYVHAVRNTSMWPVCTIPNIFFQNRTKFPSTIPALNKIFNK